jgi:glycosyltransferase involved in cell wall biosynthesis
MIMDQQRFICGFPGRRDGYQVPAALAERGRLELFLTDFYWSGVTESIAKMIFPARRIGPARLRQHPAIPEQCVRVLWSSSLRRCVDTMFKCAPALRYAMEGIRFAEAARDEARRRHADLLLYPPCSHEAFTAAYPRRQPRRILFQFHPHPSYQERLLRSDLKENPEMIRSFHDEAGDELPDPLKKRDQDAWRDADLVICASSFTQNTLLEAGADSARCIVIPYGIDDTIIKGEDSPPPRAGFHVLFVGTGSQRKGLHHLLRAWNIAKLPKESSLTIVSRHSDPGLNSALTASRRTTLLSGGVSARELKNLYATSTLFAMPSLIEGFGAVFLEAMSHGCPVLGTSHTCLPDLGAESEGVFLTPIGDSTAMAARLESLAVALPCNLALRRAAADRAMEFTWPRFRHGLNLALDATYANAA